MHFEAVAGFCCVRLLFVQVVFARFFFFFLGGWWCSVTFTRNSLRCLLATVCTSFRPVLEKTTTKKQTRKTLTCIFLSILSSFLLPLLSSSLHRFDWQRIDALNGSCLTPPPPRVTVHASASSSFCQHSTPTATRSTFSTRVTAVSKGPDPQAGCVLRKWDKTYNCYGSRQTLTLPSDSALYLMRIAHA